MPEIMSQYNVTVRGNMCRCPFHGKDRHPSMKVFKDGANCFTCGWNGDIFKFVQEMEHCDFKTAFYLLGGTYEHKSEKERVLSNKKIERSRKEAEKLSRAEHDFKMLLSKSIRRCRLMIIGSEPMSDTWCFAQDKLPYLVGVWDEKYINGQEVNEINVLGTLKQVGRKFDSFSRGHG